MSRTLNVVRMQLANRETFVWVPLLILGSAFAISMIIWGILSSAGVTVNMYGGGAQAPLWYFVAVGVQAARTDSRSSTAPALGTLSRRRFMTAL